MYAHDTISPLPATRTVEDSLHAISSLMSQAESLLFNLHGAITGYRPQDEPSNVSSASGIMHDADALAGRLQAFVTDFERTYTTITSANVTGMGEQTLASHAKRQFG